MTSDVPWGSVLRSVLFNIFISDIDSRIKCIVSKLADDTKMSCAVDMPEGPGQAGKVGPCEPHEVQQGQEEAPAPGSQQSLVYQYRLGHEGIESSPAEKDLGVLVNENWT